MRSYRLRTAHGVLPRADTSTVIATAALLSAALCGLLLAQNVSLGIALLIALCYGPLVAVNLPAALAVWVTVLFLRHLPVVSVGPNAAGLMVAFAWLATLRQRREALATLVRRHSRLLGAFFLLLVWFALSLAWAEDTSLGLRGLWQWPVVILLFFVVSTTVTRPEHVRWLLLAFLLGAVTSVLIGLAGGGLSSSADAIERATQTEGRLQGGAGDPNFLAAGLVPAAVIAGALIGPVRSVIWRILLVGSLALMAVGLAATQSRGALLAAGMVLIVGLVVFKQQRAFFIAVATVMVTSAGLWFAAYPSAWTRVTSFDDGGNGRSELWHVAERMSTDHPVTGVGLNNFRARSAAYVQEPGSLEYVRLIVERPHVVHNMYLELLAETGVIGFLLYMSVVAACLNALRRAARRFDVLRERSLALMARAALVGCMAMLTAGVFISYAGDARMWVLLSLGPAMLAIASRAGPPRRAPGLRSVET